MDKENHTGYIASFRVIATFVLLAFIGISVIPLLDLNYKPSRTNNTLTISYSWHNVSPEIIEREVTSRIEGTLATLQGVTEIYSESATGSGFVRLKFDEVEDQQLLRFEIATLIRQVTSSFPQGVSYPIIYYGSDGEDRTLMTYTLNGKYSPQELQEYAETHIRRPLSNVRELREVNVYGAEPVEWELSYDIHQLTGLGLSPDDLAGAIRNYLAESPLGLTSVYQKTSRTREYIGVYQVAPFDREIPWHRIPVTKKGNRIIFLNTVSKIRKTYQEPASYYRINGLNAINIVLVAAEQVNELVAGRKVKELMGALTASLPEHMTLIPTYDSTEHMQSELFSIVWRMGLSIFILLVFVWITSRNLAYMAVVLLGILVNVLVAFIFYFLLGIEIQLYSLAGLTISLGIIIDNTIVMIDHLRNQHNRNVFLAILAATLTTIGALSIIFFLEEEQVLRLLDFAYILAVNLLVSLAISWYFIPALMDKIRLKKRIGSRSIRNRRRVVRFNWVYLRFMGFLGRFGVAVFVLLIIGFGLPIYLLPDRLGEKDAVEFAWYEDLYNASLGSDWYRNTLHTPLQKWLGGTLYQFYRNVYTSSFYGEPERTTLYFIGRMPPGANIHQVNEVFKVIENFISQFDEVEQFETRITGIRNARITIRFKPQHEMTYFPYYLKARLTEKAIYLGGIESSIYGVGRGFSNALNLGYKNTHLYLYGYSYQHLLDIAEGLRTELLTQERIKEVDIQGTSSFSGAPTYEFYMAFDPYEIKRQGIGIARLSSFLSETDISEQLVWRGNIEGTVANLNIKPDENNLLDTWNLRQFPITTGDSLLHKLKDLGAINIRKSGDKIVRRDQQYQVVLAFDYIGSNQLKKRVVDRFIEETNEQLPIGYFIEQRGYWGWREDGKQYGLIGLVILIIFIIGATLFESLRQPLFAILIIPVSFMGIFLTFYLFELNFDQGGYASFILLSGISVNAAFFIINDYNNLKKKSPGSSPRVLYLKAFNHKILPILLTIISTVAGMIPFLIDGQNQVFWFALAAGTVGGLIFSIVGVFVVLPIFLRRKHD